MILALTGAIGSGKSLALGIFSDHGFAVCDADKLAHDIYGELPDEKRKILVEYFGEQIFDVHGHIVRRELAGKVFSSEDDLKFLTSIIHPLLRKKILRLITEVRANGGDLIVEAAVLFEAGWQDMFDKVIVLYTAKDIRHLRLHERGLDEIEMSRREALQLSDQEKLELADYGLINNGDEGFLRGQIEDLCANLRTANIK